MFKSPYLLRLYDHGQAPSKVLPGATEVYLLMPLFSGGSLQDKFERTATSGSSIPEAEAAKLFLAICQGVKEFHTGTSVAWAHRDLKPANVLLAGGSDPVLMDFGSAAPAKVTAKTRAEAVALQDIASQYCTAPYRAPELWNVETGSTVDERVDVWSLGCIAYGLAFLEGPFDRVEMQGGSFGMAISSATSVPVPVEKAPGKVSPAWVEVIDMCLNPDPAARPSVTDVIARVQAIVDVAGGGRGGRANAEVV